MVAVRRRKAAPESQRRGPRRTAAANPSGAHALAEHAARRLVRDAGVEPGELVLDIGAGLGAVTRPLARTGARIIAIERDERIAGKLAAETAVHPSVTVVTGDALAVPLPRRPYRVVASIPFAITTALLRRLVETPMVAADLVVELGAGRRLAAEPPVRREVARWQRRFQFSLGPVIPAHLFRPAPPVSAVVLRLRRPVSRARSPRSGRGHR